MAITREDLMRAGIGTGGMNPNVIQVNEIPVGRLPAAVPVAAPVAPAQAAPQRQGLLGGFFGPEGRDARARLAIGLEGMTLNPNTAMIEQLQSDIENRATARQNNATVAWLRSRNRNDLADAVETGGLPAADAMKIALEPAPTVDPQSAIAKLAADLSNGLITQEQFDIAAAGLAPQGMTIESDGKGGFRLIQGAGAGDGKALTEAQSKFAVFQTDMNQAAQTIDELEKTYDPTNLQDAASGVLGEKWGSFLQTPQGQIYKSAAYQWLDSGIRIRTGAAATTDEVNRQYAAMFPQPGDLPETVQYKRRARENFMRSVDEALRGVRAPLAPEAPKDVFLPSGAGNGEMPSDEELIKKYGG